MKGLATAVAAGLIFAAGGVLAQEHPQMEAAKADLEKAKSELQAAGHDYAGHRKQAIGDIDRALVVTGVDRKSTRLNSSHRTISYAVFCLKKKKQKKKCK